VAVDFSPASIEAAAGRRTGLPAERDELAEQALGWLSAALRSERLSGVGRIAARQYLVMLAANRRRAAAFRRQHPDVAETPVRRPRFIVGLPRTGTTLLYNLLAQETDARPLRAWETLWPVPPADDEADEVRPRRTRRLFQALHYAAPGLQAVHRLDADAPEECTWLMAHTFVSQAFRMAGDLDSYQRRLDGLTDCERRRIYAYYLGLLQIIGYGETGRRWVLKSPAHLSSLDALLATFPDAEIIYAHRDPAAAVASGCSMMEVSRRAFGGPTDRRALGHAYLAHCAETTGRATEVCAAQPARFVHVRYDDLVRDPLGTVHRILANFGREPDAETNDRIRRFLDGQRPRPRHHYRLADFGLTDDEVDARYCDYRAQFLAGDGETRRC
jgi:hypothetical protein